MRKRETLLFIGILVCVTTALGSLISVQLAASERSERNIQIICNKLQRIDGEPCNLLQPGDGELRLFAFIRRAASATPRTAYAASDCPVIVSSRNKYHLEGGPYRALVARRGDNCFPTVAAAIAAGAQAPR